jgi:hypothetical protein
MTTGRGVAVLALLITAGLAGCAAKSRKLTNTPVAGPPMTRPVLRPETQPSSRPSYHVTSVEGRLLPGQTFLSIRRQATFADLPQSIDLMMPDLMKLASGPIPPTGPITFIYHDARPELNRPFELEIGYPVSEGTKVDAPFRVRPLPVLFAGTVTYWGPLSLIDKAYDQLVPGMRSAGLEPGTETREIYERFEGPDSPNNQVLIGIGAK